MKKIIIIGGGFAGLWAAFSAVRLAKMHDLKNEVSITLINKDQYHGLRPRYYEENLDNARINLEKFLSPLGVKLVIGEVTKINYVTQKVILNSRNELAYDRLILASGSQLCTPEIQGLKEHTFNVDTYKAAKKLQKHIEQLPEKSCDGQYTIVVAGGGFTGVEVATNLMDRLKKLTLDNKARVIIVDRSKVASRFSLETQAVIFNAFNDMNIESISGVEITKIAKDYVELNSGEIIKTQTVVWTAGMQSNKLTQQFDIELDQYGRLPVDRFLRVIGIKNCFAAGDVAAAITDGVNMALLSCQHAMPQGRFSGNNAIADLFGKELLMYEQPIFVTSIDLGSWGALYSEGWNQQVIATKEAAKEIKNFINHDRIYPPSLTNGIDMLLDAAEPIFKSIKI